MMWMIIQTVKEYRKQNYSLVCNSFDTKEKGMASIVWVFYLSKVIFLPYAESETLFRDRSFFARC